MNMNATFSHFGTHAGMATGVERGLAFDDGVSCDRAGDRRCTDRCRIVSHKLVAPTIRHGC